MADERYTFEQARVRLDEIASQVRKKDTSLEKSLELLEEGVRLAGICTELVDHTDFSETRTVPLDETAETTETDEPTEPTEPAESAENAEDEERDATVDTGTPAAEIESED